MNLFLSVGGTLLSGVLLAGIWFLTAMVLDSVFDKKNLKGLMFFTELLAALPLLVLVLIFMGTDSLIPRNLGDWRGYAAALLTVLLTLLIVSNVTPKKRKTPREIVLSGVNGLIMEVPQRLLMQSFTWGLLRLLKVKEAGLYAVLCTAVIWCLGILIQNAIGKVPMGRDVVLELLASFLFSVGIGYVFQKTGFILLTMLAHSLERVLNSLLANRRVRTKN